jgi:hypothetical protein
MAVVHRATSSEGHSARVSPCRWATFHAPLSRRYTWVARNVYVRGCPSTVAVVQGQLGVVQRTVEPRDELVVVGHDDSMSG